MLLTGPLTSKEVNHDLQIAHSIWTQAAQGTVLLADVPCKLQMTHGLLTVDDCVNMQHQPLGLAPLAREHANMVDHAHGQMHDSKHILVLTDQVRQA